MKSYSFETDDIVNLKHLPILNKIFDDLPSKKTLLKFAYSHSVEHTIDLLIFVIFLKDKI